MQSENIRNYKKIANDKSENKLASIVNEEMKIKKIVSEKRQFMKKSEQKYFTGF